MRVDAWADVEGVWLMLVWKILRQFLSPIYLGLRLGRVSLLDRGLMKFGPQ